MCFELYRQTLERVTDSQVFDKDLEYRVFWCNYQ